MKKQILIYTLFLFCSTLFSQNKSTTAIQKNISPKEVHLEVYRNSLKSGDYTTAIISLNYIVVLDRDGNYKDSLAYLYYASGNYLQSIFWCNEVLKKQSTYISILEVKASSLKKTNQIALAIQEYENLVKMVSNPIYIFNLAELQYQLKRLYECLVTTQQIEKLVYKSEMIYHYQGLNDDKTKYSTPLKAALYNYQGLALYELGNKEKAIESFKLALAIDSNFILAKANIETINKELSSQNQSTPKNDSSKEFINNQEFKKD